MAVFGRNSTRCFEWSIRYSSSKHAVHSYLRNQLPPRPSIWWVVLLTICWNFEYVNSLSLRDTHRFKKRKIWNIAHFCSEKKKNLSVECSPAHRSDWYSTKNDPNSRLSMESNGRPQPGLFVLKLLKIWANFKYVNSLTRRDTWW
jgi:hypothetical protein